MFRSQWKVIRGIWRLVYFEQLKNPAVFPKIENDVKKEGKTARSERQLVVNKKESKWVIFAA